MTTRVQPTSEYETTRLRLRALRPDDAAAFAALNSDAQVMAHYLAPLTRAESGRLLNRLVAHHAAHGFGMWAVETRVAGAFIGMVGLHRTEIETRFTPCVEIGWRLLPAHWSRGYATEAGQKALRIGFQDHGLDEILAWTASTNTASQRVMQKLDMTHDPSADFHHPAFPVQHPLRWHVVYRLDRCAWKPA